MLTRQRQKLVLISILLLAGLLLLLHSHSKLILAKGPEPPSKPSFKQVKARLVFPRSFPEQADLEEVVRYNQAFKYQGFKYTDVKRRYSKTDKVSSKTEKLYSPSKINPLRIFHSSEQINLNLKKCAIIENNSTSIEVSDKHPMNTPMNIIVERMIADLDRGYDPYLDELRPYFDIQMRLQVEYEVCNMHWYRLAGSSVYLKEYGLHLMISRLVYCSDGSRNNPKMSLLYAQLYDKNWNEVRDVSLVVPTNMKTGRHFFEYESQGYTVLNYPMVLPTPFFHDYEDDGMKYLGPEDARLVLVKNEAGFEEPLLVFNSHHQKQSFVDDDEDDYILKQMKFYRSMFVSWPWQFQRGKMETDGFKNPLFDQQLYNRVKELRIKNVPRQDKQKNWTPILGEGLRGEDNFDRYLHFVYRWAHLQILRCDITDPDGKCGFVYSLNPKLEVSSGVGPFRGGTPMINVNDLIQESGHVPVSKVIPEGREIWIGFARAHLVDCGCGVDLYRPNLVVLTKDTIRGSEDEKPHEIYKMSHISSFMSLGVDIIPWRADKPYELCSGTNALIPNGISAWRVDKLDQDGENWVAHDILSLSVSISDSTVDFVHITGLLRSMLKDTSLFLKPEVDGHSSSPDKTALKIPDYNDNFAEFGYNNDNLVCAMQASVWFCSGYGHEKNRIQREHEDEDGDFGDLNGASKLDAYHDALYYVGLDH